MGHYLGGAIYQLEWQIYNFVPLIIKYVAPFFCTGMCYHVCIELIIASRIISGDEEDPLLSGGYKCDYTRCCCVGVAVPYH